MPGGLASTGGGSADKISCATEEDPCNYVASAGCCPFDWLYQLGSGFLVADIPNPKSELDADVFSPLGSPFCFRVLTGHPVRLWKMLEVNGLPGPSKSGQVLDEQGPGIVKPCCSYECSECTIESLKVTKDSGARILRVPEPGGREI